MTKLPEPNKIIDAIFQALPDANLKSRISRLEGAIQELMEFVDDYSDVVDGDDGAPEPNRAMSLLVMARDVLGRSA